MKFKCIRCGHIYDEEKEGVPFSELPDNWRCPRCGAPKTEFKPVTETPKRPFGRVERPTE